ncbi:MAG: hypothetical protein KJ737_22815 [Proteobacteria bacterium]|nr:hypothetical protein [Pseudomonadota bacterium]
MCASLCDAVVEKNNSAQILEQIYKANLFIVPLDEYGKWYRYHKLFAELLWARIEKSDTCRLNQSHLRASLWFEKHQYADEAILHAMSGKDMDRVVDLMEKFGTDYLYRGKRKTVYRWLSLLPEALIKKSYHIQYRSCMGHLPGKNQFHISESKRAPERCGNAFFTT